MCHFVINKTIENHCKENNNNIGVQTKFQYHVDILIEITIYQSAYSDTYIKNSDLNNKSKNFFRVHVKK